MKTLPKSLNQIHRPPLLLTALAFACTLSIGSVASAVEINTGNTDLKGRFDTTVRYNLGIRAQNCDVNICGNGAGAGDVTSYQSDAKFRSAGAVITNRIDLLPEFDLSYKNQFGVRLSGAAWYDAAYKNRIKGDPALDATGVGQGAGTTGGPYTHYTKRYAAGPSGELLDAFVYGKFLAGEVPIAVKLGQHNIYWGESLFSFTNGIAIAQGQVDFRKAVGTPGIEAKEVFRPLNQLSATADLTDRISVAAQYYLDWKATLLPDGGTYFGAADGLSNGGHSSIFGVPFNGITAEPKNKRGDFGVALKLRPEWLDASLGLYFREYTDKSPQLVFDTGSGGFGLDYSTKRQKLLGLSLAKQVGDVSVGMDLTYRKDAQIGARPFTTPAGGPIGNTYLPTANVIAGVVNAIAYFGKNPLFDSAVLQAEVNFSHVQKITNNPAIPAALGGDGVQGGLYMEGYNCPQAVTQGFPYGCVTKNAVGIAAAFEPKWFQAIDGVDVSMPLFLGVGVKGNSAVAFGDNKGQGSYGIGVSGDIYAKYLVTLKYNGFLAKHDHDELGAGSNSNASLGKYWDRNWVSLTFKTTF